MIISLQKTIHQIQGMKAGDREKLYFDYIFRAGHGNPSFKRSPKNAT